MLIKNGRVLTDNWTFEPLDLLVMDGCIAALAPHGTLESGEDGREDIDADGLLVVPGLIDIHVHGSAGFDFSDGNPIAFDGMARFLATRGVTAFLGTAMSLEEDCLTRVLQAGQHYVKEQPRGGARMHGMRLEGPFLNPGKKGAQSSENIQDPDSNLLERLFSVADGQIKIIDIAPELPGALPLIRQTATRATVSVGHTNADYETAMHAFSCGASLVTHLFNAMPPFLHREPGVIGAASDAGAMVELIADGFHLHPAVIRAAFRWFGPDHLILVSDATSACGMVDGIYELGGQKVELQQGRVQLANGTLAGSAADLLQCVRNAIHFGIPFSAAIKAATLNPAMAAGLDSIIGSLSIGKRADLILLNQQHDMIATMIGGYLDIP
jgi:N-acetylglucosamine-6-phosphate deacetylase